MDLAAVMTAVSARLGTIDGLRCHRHPVGSIVPPAAVVAFPLDITYDATYGRGSDRMTLPLFLVVGKASDRAAADAMAKYADGSGTRSIKAVLESGTYTAFDDLHVVDAEFDVVSIGGTDYLSALFTLAIIGSGA